LSKTLVKREAALEKNSGLTLLFGLAIVGLIIWLIVRARQASAYTNAEEWNVTYSEDGLPTKIVISRHAQRG